MESYSDCLLIRFLLAELLRSFLVGLAFVKLLDVL